MIAAYRRSDCAATCYKIAWVIVALQDLEGHGRCLGPSGFRASAVVDRCGPAGRAPASRRAAIRISAGVRTLTMSARARGGLDDHRADPTVARRVVALKAEDLVPSASRSGAYARGRVAARTTLSAGAGPGSGCARPGRVPCRGRAWPFPGLARRGTVSSSPAPCLATAGDRTGSTLAFFSNRETGT